MIKRLQKRYALSEQGAKDLVKGCLACVLQNLSFMFPVGLLFFLSERSAKRRCSRRENRVLYDWLRGVHRADSAHHIYSV